jgi:choline-sulfatase
MKSRLADVVRRASRLGSASVGPLTLVVALLTMNGCSGSGAPRHRGAPLVIVSIDTLRADHLPAYGYGAGATPNLDRFRRDAILFENAVTHVPLTLPAHVSLFTGRLPFEHGVRDNLGYRLDTAAHPTLAARLRSRGYASGGFVSAQVLRADTGIGHGFDVYDDHIAVPAANDALGRAQRGGEETLRLALDWLRSVREKPFFLFFHTYEPHAPWQPPEPYKSRHAHPYDGEIERSDEIVGSLLEALRREGLYDRAVIVVLSDHGEGLGEHGEEEHGVLLYRWALHVPLLLKLPGSERAGASIGAPVAISDVVPTLLTLLDLPPDESLPGRSLLSAPESRRLYAETYYPRIHLGWSELRSLLDERYQYIEGTRRELYDLRADPKQLTNRIESHGQLASSLQKDLAAIPAELQRPAPIGAEEREALAALGYLGGAVEPGAGPLPDPRASLPLLADVKAAFRLSAAGRDAEAVEALHRLLDKSPALVDARYELGQALERLGRHAEAHDAYRAALRSSPSLSGPLAIALSRVCVKLGRLDEAANHARVAAGTNPGEGHELLARIALQRGELAAAEREAQAAGGRPGAAVVRAELHIRGGRFAEALAILDAEKARVSEAALVPDVDFLRGDALARLGRYSDAEAAFAAEIQRYPKNVEAYARLAILYGLAKRPLREVDQLFVTMAKARPDPDTLELAAKTLEAMGDSRGARLWRDRARAMRSKSPQRP